MVEQAESFKHAVEIVLEQTKAGIAVIAREKLLQVSVLLGFSLNLIIAPIQILVPLFVTDIKGQTLTCEEDGDRALDRLRFIAIGGDRYNGGPSLVGARFLSIRLEDLDAPKE